MESVFQFKQFSIKQDLSSMKVGTDGTLLGAWCNINDRYRVLDIGTGTGLIALMIAQRNSLAYIDAIEIDEDACKEANYNFQHSPWKERLSIIHQPLQQFTPSQFYDLIVSNPPYFDDANENKNEKLTIARHTEALGFNDVIDFAKKHLYENGLLSVILPVIQAEKFAKECFSNGLFLNRKMDVYANTSSEKPIRVMMEFSKEKSYSVEEKTIRIETETRHEFTEEYMDLTKDFFLKF
jgi:tRNA1Val (adenine37-N6)-methyltransferase